jgi:hypothetical protein
MISMRGDLRGRTGQERMAQKLKRTPASSVTS